MYLSANGTSPCEDDMLLFEGDSVLVETDIFLFGNDIAPYPMHGARGYILHFENTGTWEKVSFSC